MRIKFLTILLPILILIGCSKDTVKKAPDFALKGINGGTVRLSDYKGKVIILDFWATWCGPCITEIPAFVNLMKQHSDEGLVVIGLNLDANLSARQIQMFAQKMKINYPIAMLGNSRDVMHQYGGINSIPTTFIIDRDGIIRDKAVGAHRESYFEERIVKLL